MATKKLQIIGSLGSNVEIDATLAKSGAAADAKAVGDALSEKQPIGNYALQSDIESLSEKVGDESVSEQINAAIANKADANHTHDDLELYDTVSGAESIEINTASDGDLVVTLTSETITDFSTITAVLTSEDGEQTAIAASDGVVTGLTAQPSFTLSLESDDVDFDPTQVTISCTYKLDLNKVLQDYVLHVDVSSEGDGSGGLVSGGSVVIDDTLSIVGAAADAKATGDRFATMESQIADLLYNAITITSFTNNVGTVEKGRTIDSVILTWVTSKAPESITINGESVDKELTSYTYDSLSLTSNETWKLSVADERSSVATKDTSITFLNGVYYGASAEPTEYNSGFVLSLTKKLSSGKVPSFSATSGEGQYIYYCLPTSMGACAFNVGGFDGGFTLVTTIAFTNAYNHTENYYIYRSDNANLGTKTVKVS